MIETHPFGDFIPSKVKYLILGSFTGKGVLSELGYDWYYGTKANQFWRIIEQVYGIKLEIKPKKIELFTKLQIGIADIIYQCERKKGSNLDSNLINIVYNFDAIEKILNNYPITKVFFTSRFVENKFMKKFGKDKFKHIEFIALPSPSPRYAQMPVSQKIITYKMLLPKML